MTEKKFNKMCLDCVHLGELCSGTTKEFWSGCVWKNSDYDAMKSFGDSIQEAIDNRKEGVKK